MPPPIQPPTPEKLPAVIPETREQIGVAPWERPPVTPAGTETSAPAATPAPPAPTPQPPGVISPLQQQVEQVLEQGLEGLYRDLTPQQQIDFKVRGETVARQLAVLLQQVKVKVSQVLKLIREWLMSIPGINRYFVEQEAKIKADKLLRLR